MATYKYNPADTRPFGFRQLMYGVLVCACTILLLFVLAAFGMQEQEIADPVSTSAIPQPDWLFVMLFQTTRYFQDGLEVVGVFWIPVVLSAGLFLLPYIGRGSTGGKRLQRALIPLCTALFLIFSIVTFHTVDTTPLWSCASCHKKGFGRTFAATPTKIADFSKRYDNKWLALHYRFPQYFWMMDADVPSW
jgi:hypothetical protein